MVVIEDLMGNKKCCKNGDNVSCYFDDGVMVENIEVFVCFCKLMKEEKVVLVKEGKFECEEYKSM